MTIEGTFPKYDVTRGGPVLRSFKYRWQAEQWIATRPTAAGILLNVVVIGFVTGLVALMALAVHRFIN